ncbi:MAG TPA: bifunctional folylpolyglutamate synthase/dihydrofolate synthase [Campylobacterales bacterium]|nr:bifunctional folylpolyglutamate synthase/dihydrofolate synthase [Campylobacterales bacterium]
MSTSPTFQSFITNKPLYYKEIDHERVHIAYNILKPHIQKPMIIHIVGTNGKGSTGRIMAILLHASGKRVGHFSSPHIIKFNERIWIDGEDVSDNSLEKAHAKLYPILGQKMSEALSYFEYTTLLALVAMEELDIIILEAGLGGEFDATNVVEKALSVITPIGLDHQDFLGDTIKSIATTKINSIDKQVIVGIQPNIKVYNIARDISQKKGAKLYILEDCYNKSQAQKIEAITKEIGWSHYLYENALLAINALDILKLPYNIIDLKSVKLFGRFYSILPNVIIDVGHNLLATGAIVNALEQKFGDKKVVLVYNSLDDKDYSAILEKLKKHIKRVEIISIDTPRAVEVTQLQAQLERLSIEFKIFENINNYENYLVFGSFYVVEAFIKKDLLQI